MKPTPEHPPHKPPGSPTDILICYAVREEAGRRTRALGHRILICGMGARNAERSIREAISARRPGMVITCGFAGGLNPAYKLGDVLFDVDPEFPLAMPSGTHPARFHTALQVLARAVEKIALRERTGDDAVEMESGHIRAICKESRIPSATLRVILDTSDADLPLDFNLFMTPAQKLDFAKLAWAIAKRPGMIKGLLRLQKESAIARLRLDDSLATLLSGSR